MPTFSYRKKNVKISVRCGARCRAYHASSMGEGKGPPHNCAPARFLFFCFFNSMESAFPYEENISVQPNPGRSARAEPSATRTDFPPAGRGASPPAKPYSSVRRHHVYRPGRASGDPGVVLHCPQSLISSFGSTTSIGRAEPPATRAWCFTARKALFLRPETPRHLVRLSLRRLGRGASPSAKPYSFVRKHHVYRPGRASGDPDVVLHRPQRLIPPSGGTTSIGPAEPPATRASLFP